MLYIIVSKREFRFLDIALSLFKVMLININSISVSAANRLNILFAICKVVTILTVIIVGLVRIGQGLFFFQKFQGSVIKLISGHTQNFQNGFAGTDLKKEFFNCFSQG